MIPLDERLSTVKGMVRSGSRVADIGTDHGYLIAQLLLEEKASFGYACDIHQKPLEKAEKTLRRYGLQNRSRLLLGDGLSGLLPEQVDDIVIAGMGADTILHILDEAGWQNSSQRFLLQPMTKHPTLREGLYQRGYEMLEERAVSAKGFSYTVIQARWCGKMQQVDSLFAQVGLLPQFRSAEAEEYLEKRAQTLGNVAKGLEKSNTNSNKQEEYYKLSEGIFDILKKWKEKEG